MISKSAGRICLFGDHQDYLGLPVIAAAINKHISIRAKKNDSNFIDIEMPDIAASRRIDLREPFKPFKARDYFLSALHLAKTQGCVFDGGIRAEITSTIPINAGASSSSALVVAWVNLLFELYSDEKLSPLKLAKLAHQAEVSEHGEPGGQMDHFASAIGDLLYIENNEPSSYEKLKNIPKGFILANSNVAKETLGTLAKNKTNAQAAIKKLKEIDKNFNIHTRLPSQLKADLAHLEDKLKPVYKAAIQNHTLTREAYKLLKKNADILKLSELMNAHHAELRDNLKLTVPKIDSLINIAMQNGAYAAKINGSGLGGTVLILAPENQNKIIEELREMNVDASQVQISRGAEICYD